MHSIDWIIAVVPLVGLLWLVIYVHRYVRSVADFLAGGRLAGRYLLTVASGETSLSVIGLVAAFEQAYKTGFAIGFWHQAGSLLAIILSLTGFIVYRFRETRAMTLGQFFEIRYSRNFRVLAGFISFFAGALQYALFPAVSARFFLYYCRLPLTFSFLGLTWSTFGVLLAVFLMSALVILFLGGHLGSMVTDCAQGLLTYVLFTALILTLLLIFTPSQFREVLLARPAGQSFVNPFNTQGMTDFNILYIFIGIFMANYTRMAWQGQSGYNCSARSPHEQKMANVLATWREGFGRLKVPLLVMAAYILLNHPAFSQQAAEVHQELQACVNFANPVVADTIKRQMLVPLALRHILPIGLVGAFAALMLMAMISTDTTYLQSWGSILVQDVILPFRKKALTPRAQINLIRLGVFLVAILAFFFSLLFNQVTFIVHFFNMTAGLWMGFAGVIIIGGLYWRRGTTAGAWTAAVIGVSLGGLGFWLQSSWSSQIYPWLDTHFPAFLRHLGDFLHDLGARLPIAKWEVGPKKFPLSGMEWTFLNAICSITGYIVVSLLTVRTPFNLERMLHRECATTAGVTEMEKKIKVRFRWTSLLGFTPEYTKGDKILAVSVFSWVTYNHLIFIVFAVWNLCFTPWPERWWFNWFFYYGFGVALIIGTVSTVWFTWGGTRDLLQLFRALPKVQRDVNDDGRVAHDTDVK